MIQGLAAAKSLKPLEGHVLLTGAEILDCSNGRAPVDSQGRMPDALTPALPTRDDGIGVNGKLPAWIAGAVKTVGIKRNAHCLEFRFALKRNRLEFLVELLD